MQAIFSAVRESLYGWSNDSSIYLRENIADTVSMVTNYTTPRTNGRLAYSPTYAMIGDNPNAGTETEVIAPLSKLQAMFPTGRQRAELTNNPRRSIDCQGSRFGICSRKRELQNGGLGWVSLISG